MAKRLLELNDVTMMEAVQTLRENRLFLQFEREYLDESNTDYNRPIVDSRRRFTVTLALDQPVDLLLDTLVGADGGYDWTQLTDDPESYWIFPRAATNAERFASAVMNWKAEKISTHGRPLSEVVEQHLGLEDHGVLVFDRPGFLDQVSSAADVETGGRPLYQVLGELFALSGQEITWTLAGLGPDRVLSIGRLPPL
jgi:hypothetical protein